MIRICYHMLSDACSKSQTKVRVNVDLAYSHSCCLTKLILGNTDGILQSTAVCIDDLNIFLRNRRCTVKNDGEAGQSLCHIFQNVKSQLRLGAGFELVCAVACTDGDSQGINAGAVYEFLNLFRSCIGGILCRNLNIIFDAGQSTKLCLNYYASLMSIVCNLLCQSNVLFEGLGGTVDHNGSEAAVDAGLADFKICAVVQMQSNGKIRIDIQSSLNETLQLSTVRILSCAGGSLEDNRGLLLSSSLGDGLYDLHVVYIECTDGIAAFICFLKHFSCCN